MLQTLQNNSNVQPKKPTRREVTKRSPQGDTGQNLQTDPGRPLE